MTSEDKTSIRSFIQKSYLERHRPIEFVPGVTEIPVTGKVFGIEEVSAAVEASLDFWLTAGPHTAKFEKLLADFVTMRRAFMVNSGSSANLLALTSLTSKAHGSRRLTPGDEVITVAAGFPTTVTPILQNQLVPVYVDINLETYVGVDEQIAEAISPRTKAIMMAHTLGNPFNLDFVTEIARKNNLWLIEDSCDALGGEYKGKKLGSFGDLSTFSFYPAHHITTGEGGAVLIKDIKHSKIVESFRDWGRACWCAPGCDNTCFKRYEWESGELPKGYDHKYTYSHLGYNLKSGDIQAAIGVAQMDRIETFTKLRRRNWEYLREGLKDLEDYLLLPQATPESEPSWFGFAITLRKNSPATRDKIVIALNEKKIATRLLFAGNLTRQPAFLGTPMRIVGNLNNSDFVMNNTFWIGVWPGLTEKMLDYVIDIMHRVVKET